MTEPEENLPNPPNEPTTVMEDEDALWASVDEASEPGEVEAEEDAGPSLQDLRDDFAAAGAEWKRGARRTMDALKELNGAVSSMSMMVRDLTLVSRVGGSAQDGLPREWALALVELADRVGRLASASSPAEARSWWPGAKAALAAWRSAWETQQAALSILQGHVSALLARAQLLRVAAVGQAFDPNCMTAVEAVTDSSAPDHTVVAELLPGWRHATGQVLRPAQVRVSRR